MTYRNIVRGCLVSLGVALGLIGTAGAAFAADVEDGNSEVQAAAESSDPDAVGDALYIERPAPGRDPATELRVPPAVALAPAPLAAPAAPAASASAVVPAATPGVAVMIEPAPARIPISRSTQVKGVQFERSEDDAALARTGVDTFDLAVLGVVLLAVGMLLVRRTKALPAG